jgi:hypothetical protein
MALLAAAIGSVIFAIIIGVGALIIFVHSYVMQP